MRIIVASPAKTGNMWIKRLLADVYGLKVIDDEPGIPVQFLEEFIRAGRFEDDTIFHQHYHPEESFFRLAGEAGAHLVTTIRHPYDVFVSLYFYVQRLSHLFVEGTEFYPIVGKPLEDEEVLRYLKRDEDGFGFQIRLALDWMESRRSIIVRYEDLVTDAVGTVRGLTDRIRAVDDRRIRRAVKKNQAKRLRWTSWTMKKHIRAGTMGDWRNHLTETHLEAINSIHGPKIERLGYMLHENPGH